MEFNESQVTNLGKYLLDISKLIIAIYVFTSFPDKLNIFTFGIIGALLFLTAGLIILKGVKK